MTRREGILPSWVYEVEYCSSGCHLTRASKETLLTDFGDLLPVKEGCHEFITLC